MARSSWTHLGSTEDLPLQVLTTIHSSSNDKPLPPFPRQPHKHIGDSSSSTSSDDGYHEVELPGPNSPVSRGGVFNRGYRRFQRNSQQRLADAHRPWGPARFNLAGWRMGVFWSAVSVVMILLTNVCVTIWAVSVYPVRHGLGTIHEGSCDRTKSLSLWLHLAINVLSSLVLGGSNYTQQCLMAPTRKEVDAAHARGAWVDIGVPSVRNMARIARRRGVLWWGIGLMSVPLHLLYNSAVYSTIAATNYAVVIAQENTFESGAPPLWRNFTIESNYNMSSYQYSTKAIVEQMPVYRGSASSIYWENIGTAFSSSATWERLKPADCLREYNKNLLSTRRNLVVVTYGSPNKTVSTHTAFEVITDREIEAPQIWMCCYNEGRYCDYSPNSQRCDNTALARRVASGANWTISAQAVPHRIRSADDPLVIKECRSERLREVCRLQFSTTILTIVIVCGAVKAVCMAMALLDPSFTPLITIGDAIESFLATPDPNTAGICYASRQYIVRQYRTGRPWNTGEVRPWRWKSISYRWFRAVSFTRWITSLFICIFVICVCGGLLSVALASDSNVGDITMAAIWSRGFGRVNASSIVSMFGMSLDIHAAAILANLPQAILSGLYLLYNALFTCMLMAREYAAFASRRKALRVSVPHGSQRDTYWLHIPYRFAVPLNTLSALLHWLTSQSLFLARIDIGSALPKEDRLLISTAGYSSVAIIFTLILGGVALAVAVGVGMQSLKTDMPLAGSCSAAISAHCHPPPGMTQEERLEMVRKRLKWGDVSGNERVGHLAFTDEDVIEPVRWGRYAGYGEVDNKDGGGVILLQTRPGGSKE